MANKCNLYQIFKFSIGVILRDHVPIMEAPPAAPGDFMRPFLTSHMSKQWEMICWTTQNAFLDFYGYIFPTPR